MFLVYSKPSLHVTLITGETVSPFGRSNSFFYSVPLFVNCHDHILTFICYVMDVDFRCIGGARAQQIHRRPSGDLDPRRLLRFQNQAGRAGVEFGELEHPQLGGNPHPCVMPIF